MPPPPTEHAEFARCPQPLPMGSPSLPVSSCELNKNTRRCHQQPLATHLSCRLYQTCDHAVLISGRTVCLWLSIFALLSPNIWGWVTLCYITEKTKPHRNNLLYKVLVSFGLVADISLYWCYWCCVDGTSDVLVVLITHCRACLSWAVKNHISLWCFQSGWFIF